MKILSVADHVDPLVYSPNIKNRFSEIDLVLGAGDLDIAFYEFIVSSLNKPLYFVFGNHNLKKLSIFRPDPAAFPTPRDSMNGNVYHGSICVDGKVIRDKKNNLIIAGLGGSRRYNQGAHQFTEAQMFHRALKLFPKMLFFRIFHGRWVDILLTHATPKGIHDRDDPCHRGFSVFLWFMKKFKPRYLIHGHVHLYDINALRETQHHNTQIINAYDHIVFDWEKGMNDSPYVNVQAEQDFSKAKQKAWVQSLKGILNPEARELLSFHDIKSLVKPGKETYLGMKVVSLDKIVGSEDRYHDFSGHFFPKKEHLRHRWMSIDRAYLTDVILPPIKLLKIGELYFVRDGNHRVSVARSQGVMAIDAEVIELTAHVPVAHNATREDILSAVLAYERSSVLEQTDLGRIIPVEMIEFTATGRWHEILNHIEGHKYFINLGKKEEIPFEDAARSWYNNLYLPIVEIIREESLVSRFPGRTEADLYIWIIKHWHSLKDKYGQDFPLNQGKAFSHG